METMTKQEGVRDMNIGIEPLCSRHIDTSRDVVHICIYIYMRI